MDTNLTVVITGGTAGIGRATARAFAKGGFNVAVLARGNASLNGTAKEIEQFGRKALAIETDVSDYEQVDKAAERVEKELGPIDIWVNDAMTTIFSEFMDVDPKDFKRVTEVDYLGFVYGTRAALKRMIPRNKGIIIQVGSALAYRGIPLQSAYCGAKHAIQGFNEALRSELIHNNINVHLTMVQMPALNTPQFKWCKSNMPRKSQPVPPIYQPEAAADAILYAAAHKEREVFVGFKNNIIMFGNNFFPGVGDYYLAKAGFDSQMTKEPDDKSRPFNLWEPVDTDFGAHGDFDALSKRKALILTTSSYRAFIILMSSIFLFLLINFLIDVI